MFRKITSLVMVALVAYCAWFLHQANEQQNKLRKQHDTLFTEIVRYHEASERAAHQLAALMAAPYYVKGPVPLPSPYGTSHPILGGYEVIDAVCKSSPELRYADHERQHRWVMQNTPAPILFELHEANEALEMLRIDVQWHSVDLEDARQRFQKQREAMQQALDRAANYRAM